MKYLKLFEHFFGTCPECDCSPCACQETKHDELPYSEEEFEMNPGQEEEEEEDYSGLKYVHKKWYDKNVHGEEEEEEEGSKVWGDEVVERKKAKPDFLDLDKDGDKKESMKKAAKEAKEKAHKKNDKEDKGLSAAQKKLPAGLQKAILAKKKK